MTLVLVRKYSSLRYQSINQNVNLMAAVEVIKSGVTHSQMHSASGDCDCRPYNVMASDSSRHISSLNLTGGYIYLKCSTQWFKVDIKL